jgi:hypothetical protein
VFGWLFKNKRPIEKPSSALDPGFSERERLRHEIREELVGIHRERLEYKRVITVCMRVYLACYEHTGEHLRRIEQHLKDEGEPGCE